MTSASKTEKALLFFAWVDFVMALLSVTTCIYALVVISSSVQEISAVHTTLRKIQYESESLNLGNKSVVNSKNSSAMYTLSPTPSSTSSTSDKPVKSLPIQLLGVVGTVAVKLIYLVMLFFILEAALDIFLIKTIRQKNLGRLRLWLYIIFFCTLLYITDFISSLHAISMMEDFSIALGIFVKVPLAFLGYKYYKQLSEHGQNLVNEAL